jgi:hypothetical protein
MLIIVNGEFQLWKELPDDFKLPIWMEDLYDSVGLELEAPSWQRVSGRKNPRGE